MSETIFNKIINHEIPADIIYEDDICLAFNDINPQAPIHCLIIPKPFIENVAKAQPSDQMVLGHLLIKVREIAQILGCINGFRLVINNGSVAGQEVFHLHIHLLAGRSFSWPPG